MGPLGTPMIATALDKDRRRCCTSLGTFASSLSKVNFASVAKRFEAEVCAERAAHNSSRRREGRNSASAFLFRLRGASTTSFPQVDAAEPSRRLCRAARLHSSLLMPARDWLRLPVSFGAPVE